MEAALTADDVARFSERAAPKRGPDGIHPLDPDDADSVEAVARLHRRYLAESMIARLGFGYMTRFHYTELVRWGLLHCDLCRADGEVVGFIAYTDDSARFMMRGMKRGFWRLCRVLLGALVREPAFLGSLLGVARLMLSRSGPEVDSGRSPGDPLGEGVSIATDTEHRNLVPFGEVDRMPVALFESMRSHFARSGGARFFVIVELDNRASQRFCEACGGERTDMQVAGESRYRYVFGPERPSAKGPGGGS